MLTKFMCHGADNTEEKDSGDKAMQFELMEIVKKFDDPITESLKIEGTQIVTDSSELNILYIFRQKVTSTYDSLLVQAIALRLATEIAQDITGKTELKQDLMNKYREVMSEARSADAAEGTPQKIEADLWLQSRYTSTDSWRPFSANVIQENAY